MSNYPQPLPSSPIFLICVVISLFIWIPLFYLLSKDAPKTEKSVKSCETFIQERLEK